MKPVVFKFKKWFCFIQLERFAENSGKNYCLVLRDANDFEVNAKPTAYIEGLEEDEVAIKTWSENEGSYSELLKQQIILPTHRQVTVGYSQQLLICKLSKEWLDAFKQNDENNA